jgi:uncharacterized protein YcfJ
VRRTRFPWLAVGLLGVVVQAGCRSPHYADQGAALGGVAGAITGAALGDRSGNAATGAIVGSAVGALTGAAVGDSMDAELARRQALIEERTGRKMLGRVTSSDVITLAASGISDDVITNHIRANGVAAKLTPGDIIELHENGVSEKVINAMQQKAAEPEPVVSYTRDRPIIIEEHYMVPPPMWYRHPWHYRHARMRPRSGVSWGFSFSN